MNRLQQPLSINRCFLCPLSVHTNFSFHCFLPDSVLTYEMLWLFLASRETAFVYAITSSGVVHEITKACARGLLRECVCNNTQHQGRNGRGFQWGGCNDNIEYGLKYAGEFIDSREKEQDARAKINLHNNFVGRHVSTSSNTPFHDFFNF